MKDLFKKIPYITFFSVGLFFGLLMIPICYISYEILFGIPIETVRAKNHKAVLTRNFGIIDYSLSVFVDGEEVYTTGDIWGVTERQLRAVLVWDKTGRVIAFERMGKIVFAFDAEEKRTITNDELRNYCLTPMPENYMLEHQQTCKEQ